jgi:hypothetical protein
MVRTHWFRSIVAVFALLFAAHRAFAQTFREDFNGAGLDSVVWVADLGDGQITVASGAVTLSGSGPTFPVVTTRQDPFPEGDFIVRVGMQYLSVANCGDGFGAMDNFWEDYGTGTACRPFLLWQDGGGLYVYTGSADKSAYLAAPPEAGFHIYEWAFVDGAYTFLMDGVVRGPSGTCAPRATSIFFGHPHPIGCSQWTTFSIDFIEVAPLGATPARKYSWGALKLLYR